MESGDQFGVGAVFQEYGEHLSAEGEVKELLRGTTRFFTWTLLLVEGYGIILSCQGIRSCIQRSSQPPPEGSQVTSDHHCTYDMWHLKPPLNRLEVSHNSYYPLIRLKASHNSYYPLIRLEASHNCQTHRVPT